MDHLATVKVAAVCVIILAALPCDSIGVFPAGQRLSTGKPVHTNGTCSGQEFCSHSSAAWRISEPCSLLQCNSTCPGATGLPALTRVDQFPRTSVAASQTGSVIIFNGGYLRYDSSHSPAFHGAAGFSMALTYLPISDVDVTLFSKVQQSGLSIFAVNILLSQISSQSRVQVVYTPQNATAQTTMTLQTLSQQRNGHYLSITVSYLQRQVNVFANGTLLAAGVLADPVHDPGGDLFIGALSDGTSIARFNGLLRTNIHYYPAALDERSAHELHTGTLDPVDPQSECRCSPLFPRVDPTDTSVCIHPILTSLGRASRINRQSYPERNVVDGNASSAWISQLGRTHVNMELNLQSAFEIQNVMVWFQGPVPRSAVLEISTDGISYRALQYFSNDCTADFGLINDEERLGVSQVNCKTGYETSLHGQRGLSYYADRHNSTSPISTMNPFATSVSPSTTGQHVRLRMLGFQPSLRNRTDQYYSISEFEVAGRCACNGHADFCTINSITGINQCECRYNTKGDACESCQDLFNAKPWLPGNSTSPNACLACQCNGHATSCSYNRTLDSDPSSRALGNGGQCMCRDNTAGVQCDQCSRHYYRDVSKSLNNIAVCLSCGCSTSGVSDDGDCIKSGIQLGQCNCKPNIGGLKCDQCAQHAYLNTALGECAHCNCSAAGALNASCDDASGQCYCRAGFRGQFCNACDMGLTGVTCSQCASGFWNYSAATASCRPCSCSTVTGAVDGVCDPVSGQCTCRQGFESADCSACVAEAGTRGPLCNACLPGFYGFNGTFCQPCRCNGAGSTSATCDATTGACSCLAAFTGRACRECRTAHGTAGVNCTACRDGFFAYNGSHCMPCQCNSAGSMLVGCGADGSCTCKLNVMGQKCDQCTADSLVLGAVNPEGCGQVRPPIYTAVSQTSFRLHWLAPSATGIVSYSIFEDRGAHVSALRVHFTTSAGGGGRLISGLVPLQTKRYFLRACTTLRCVNSNSSSVTTLSGVPTYQGNPAVALRNISTLISWPEAVLSTQGDVSYQLHVIESSFQATLGQSRSHGAQFYRHGYAKVNVSMASGSELQVSMTIRTFYPNCLLYLAINSSASSFMAVYVRNRQACILVSSLHGTDMLCAPATVDISDGSSHAIVTSVSTRLEIGIDGAPRSVLPTLASAIRLSFADVYIGGIPTELLAQFSPTPQFVTHSFIGCFSELEIQGSVISLADSVLESAGMNPASFGCVSPQWRGIHLLGAPSDGFVSSSLNPIAASGVDFNVSLSFRTQSPNGLLMYTQSLSGPADFAAVYIVNGSLVFAVDNGDGMHHVSVTNSTSFCDGAWHSITCTKSDSRITLSIDDTQTTSTPVISADNSCDVAGALYFGGVPADLAVHDRTVQSIGFSGCVRDMAVNQQPLNIDTSAYAQLDGCPASETTLLPCHLSAAEGSSLNPRLVYSGKSRQALLAAATYPASSDLLFRVSAVTNSGMARSNWTALHLSDSVPTGLASPAFRFAPVSRSAFVTFSPPSHANGLILRYSIVLVASPTFSQDYLPYLPRLAQSRVVVALQRNVFSHVVTDLLPARRYSVHIEASTAVGTAQSMAGGFVTPEAAPSSLRSPSITAVGSRNASVSWTLPDQPNGNLSALIVWVNGREALRSSNPLIFVSQLMPLEPYTVYSVRVEYCTAAGCAISANDTMFTTLAAAPAGVAPPTVSALGDSSIEMVWTAPTQENGIISGYDILSGHTLPYTVLRQVPAINRRVVIDQLKPATLYMIRVRATNQAGSTASIAASVTTLEGAPAGISPPSSLGIRSRNITLAWQPPAIPNGVIIRYRVIADGRAVLTVTAGMPRMATVDNLTPFTNYSYSIEACTARLCATGTEHTVRTLEDVPAGLQPPRLTVLSSTVVQASWQEPVNKNGRIRYTLFIHGPTNYSNGVPMNTTQVLSGIAESEQVYNITNVLPFQHYYGVVQASTVAGGINSSLSPTIRTLQDAPTGIGNVTLNVTSSTSLQASWTNPARINGIITQFALLLEDLTRSRAVPSVILNSSMYTATVASLLPYTTYSVQLRVSTGGGVASGSKATARTLEDVPSSLLAPTSTNVTSRGFDLLWPEPDFPNGRILRYEVFLDGPQGVRRFTTAPQARAYRLDGSAGIGLLPFTSYSVWLSACTAVGCGRSPSVAVATSQDFASGLDPPTLVSGSATGLNFTWKAPRQPNGIILSYTLRLLSSDGIRTVATTTINITQTPQASLAAVFAPLTPSTNFMAELEVRNSIGRSLAPRVTANTTDGTPENISAPVPTALNSTAIRVSWVRPGVENGKVTSYTIFRDGALLYTSASTGHFNDTGLRAYSTYTYVLMVCSRFSCANSSAVVGRTAEGIATGILAPTMNFTARKTASITWSAPAVANGIVTGYSIVVRDASACCPRTGATINCTASDMCLGPVRVVVRTNSSTLSTVVTDVTLLAYSQYAFQLVASNGAGDARGAYVFAVTPQDVPSGLEQARAVATGARFVALSWSAPRMPNGPVDLYHILRNNSSPIRLSASTTVYNDTSALRPFTVYSYVLSVCNTGKLCTTASHLVVRTAQSVPDGVVSPVVMSVSATSVHITWNRPTQPNGLITMYRIQQLTPRIAAPIVLAGADSLNATMSGLQAYTSYSYALEACTVIGCTASAASLPVRTLEAAPLLQPAPQVIALSSSSVNISWLPPMQANGIITAYKLSRNGSEIAQFPRNTSYFVDIHLSPFTVYSYVIESLNSAGSVTSTMTSSVTHEDRPRLVQPPIILARNASAFEFRFPLPLQPNGVLANITLYIDSIAVRTTSALPSPVLALTGFDAFTNYTFNAEFCTVAGCSLSQAVTARTAEALAAVNFPPNVTALNASTVVVQWTMPSEPNGVIRSYSVERRLVAAASGGSSIVAKLGPNVHTFQDSQLMPYTAYEYRVQITNGAGTSYGPWQQVRTLEGIPMGVQSPAARPLQRSVGLTWSPPLRPNGVVIRYDVLVRNASTAHLFKVAVTTRGLAAQVDGLEPYTAYSFKLSVTTGGGSGSSDAVNATTLEDVPEQLAKITIAGRDTVTGSWLNLTWSPPLQPNGIVTEYRVLDATGALEYVGTELGFLFRRLDPYTSYTLFLRVCTKVGCTDGALQQFTTPEIKPEHQLPPKVDVLSSYAVNISWSPPGLPNGVLMSFIVIRQRGSNGTQLSVGTLDPRRTVSLVFVDSGLVPFTEYRYAVQSGNRIGNTTSVFSLPVKTLPAPPVGLATPHVITQSLNSIQLKWLAPAQANGIFSRVDVLRNRTAIAQLAVSSHNYLDTGLSPALLYCYQIRYCVHVGGCSDSISACNRTAESIPAGSAVPALSAVSAFIVQAAWSVPTLSNGVITSFNLYITRPCSNGSHCLAYSGLETTSNITGLVPYTRYTFELEACTVIGCSPRSPPAQVRTLQSSPSQPAPPTLTVLSADEIQVVFTAPLSPNGVLQFYAILQNDTAVSFIDATTVHSLMYVALGLQPDTVYSFAIRAAGLAGVSESNVALARTFPEPPTNVSAINATADSSSAVFVEWDEAGEAFAKSVYYLVSNTQDGTVINTTALTARFTSLQPFSEYTLGLSTCTRFGCTASAPVKVRTQEATPVGLSPPLTSSTTGRSVTVTWSEPASSNGIVTQYQVETRLPGNATVISIAIILAAMPSQASHSFVDTNVRPVANYEYRIAASNSAGTVRSNWASIRTPESNPDDVPPPNVGQKTKSSIVASLLLPVSPNGIITSFNLYINSSGASVSLDNLNAVVTSLSPHTVYGLVASFCTLVGCTNSTAVAVQTSEDLPSGLNPPVVIDILARSMRVSWGPPLVPNGDIVRYALYMTGVCEGEPGFPERVCSAPRTLAYQGLSLQRDVLNILPFTRYFYELEASNSAGSVTSSRSPVLRTLPAAPEVIGQLNVALSNRTVGEGASFILDWSGAFRYNGNQFVRYVLRENQITVAVVDTALETTSVVTNREYDLNYSYSVVLKMGSFTEVQTRAMYVHIPVPTTQSPTAETESEEVSKPTYKTTGFIVGMALVGVVLLITLIFCLHRPSKATASDGRTYSPNPLIQPGSASPKSYNNRRSKARPESFPASDFSTIPTSSPPGSKDPGNVALLRTNVNIYNENEDEYDSPWHEVSGNHRGQANSVAMDTSGYEGPLLKDTQI